jgi:5'-nucleotidase
MDIEQKVALIDLDGTLADYHAACMAGLRALLAPGEELVDPWMIDRDDRPEWVNVRRDMVSNQPGFWRNLARIEDGFSVLDVLRNIGYSLMVLTKGPVRKTSAWTEKVDWCAQHLPGVAVTVTHDKSLVYGRVLFDDYPEYIVPWLRHRPRGLVAMLDQPWNRSFQHPQVVRVPRPFLPDSSGGLVVRAQLVTAYNR